MKSRGISKRSSKKAHISIALALLMGLVVVVFTFVIVFKLLGVWSAYQHEQQAEITAKNMQTAMNKVCVSGHAMEVNVNFPQELTSSGVVSNPLQFLGSTLKGDKEAVTDALRYITSLQSMGDPWYVIYYEDFPQGEDSGWLGWNEVAAMRISSAMWRGTDTAMCAMAIVPFGAVGKKIGKIIGGTGGTVAGVVAKRAPKAAKFGKKIAEKARAIGKTIGKIKKIKNAPAKLKEKIFHAEIGGKIAGKIKGSVDNVFKWLTKPGHSVNKLTDHVTESSHLIDVYRRTATVGDNIKHLGSGSDSLIKNIRKTADNGLYKDISNLDAMRHSRHLKNLADPDLVVRKQAFEGLGAASHHADNFYDDVAAKGRKLEIQLDRGATKAIMPEKERKVLKNLAKELQTNKVPDSKKIKQSRKIMENLKAKGMCGGRTTCADINTYLDTAEDYTNLHRMGETLKPGNFIDDAKPFRWSRSMLAAEADEAFVPGIPGLAQYVGRATKRGMQLRGPAIVTKWGTWYGTSFVFSHLLSRVDVSGLKFSPCGSNTLCLKSQVNPSITRYPLDECKEIGINYIELEKYPYLEEGIDNNKTKEGIFGLTRWIDSITGASPVSKFYTASPCKGKIRIEKGKCECSGSKNEPYFDFSSMDVFVFDCALTSIDEIECNFSKYMDYLDETEEINKFTKQVAPIQIDDVTYEINVDFTEEILKNESGYKEDNTKFECSNYITSVGDSFSCDFPLPSIPFYTTDCEWSSLWLECKNWTKTGEPKPKEKKGLEGETEVMIAEWCCLKWELKDYETRESGEIISVEKCGDYNWIRGIGTSKGTINNNLESIITKEWNIENKDDYIKSIKKDVVKAVKNTSEIELEEGKDPNDESIGGLFSHNLRPSKKIPCLKVRYVMEDEEDEDITHGFCYTSPPDGEALKDVGWMAGSIIVEAGVEAIGTAACGISAVVTGPGAVACKAVAGLGSCELGNLIMWYGQDQVAKEREKRLWPHNTFFGDYYTD